jgi:hypothetical protein
MNTLTQSSSRRSARSIPLFLILGIGLATQSLRLPPAHAAEDPKTRVVRVSLSEWKVQTTPSQIPPGPVVFEVTNAGTIPHALEIEGGGLEKSTPQIRAGARSTLRLDLHAGQYEVYCPVGKGSHKMLGMMSHLEVVGAKSTPVATEAKPGERASRAAVTEADEDGHSENEEYADHNGHEHEHDHGETHGGGEAEQDEYGAGAKEMKVTGGGTVIQILPGPFPFSDSAQAVIQNRPPDQQADLTKKSHMGPYSNNVARIAGAFSLEAIDRGASGDSVSGVATFTARDGARWKVVMDRVQTKDIPFNPRFGGVIMGLFYHGASGVHTPLVPTIQSSLALWAYAHLYKNEQLVTDNAMVHVMLLSRTRRINDWALDCWDCSERPIEELQLQVTPPPNTPPFEAPGGFLFVNWEKSSGTRKSL